VTAFHQLSWQEAVFGDETRQRRESVETGVGTGEQDGRRRSLDEDVEDIADQPIAEDRAGNLRQHRRISRFIRRCVGDKREKCDTGQQEPEYAGHNGEHPAGVAALRLTKDVDRIGDRLDARQRRTAVGESAQQHQDRRAHHQAIALMNRHHSGDVLGIVGR